jgi:hippurate hydrolase
VTDLDNRARAWRQALHRIPETAFEEHLTARFVAGVLTDLGFDVVGGVGGTGVVGSISRGTSSRAIGLRADMDALPISEVDGREHGSQHPGRMHACGHDGHMAMALGAAAALAERGDFDGTVRVVFQPAEEPGRGAEAMIDDGLLERFPLDAMYGLHTMPGIPVGHIHTRPGGIMASEDNFEIVLIGQGGHAARPDMVVDPLVAGAELVLALQTIVARNVDPVKAAVLSCTEFHTDGARNAIPGQVRITGDTRSFDPDVQALLEHRIRTTAEGIAAAHGATAAVTYTHEFAPTINDIGCTETAIRAATTALGSDRVVGNCPPIMPSEDFGVFAHHIPANFAFIGNSASTSPVTPLHSTTFEFLDDALSAGIAYYVAIVDHELPSGGGGV